jgi:hypothetical protein
VFINSVGYIVVFDFYNIESVGIGWKLEGLLSWELVVGRSLLFFFVSGTGFYHQILLFSGFDVWGDLEFH